MLGVKLIGALEEGAVPGVRRDGVADVERERVEAGQEGGLLEVVDAVGQDPGGDDDERDPGVAEELREVDPHGTAVDQHPEGDRDGDAGDEADQRLGGAGAGRLDAGVEEQRRLEALATDAEEADQGHGPAADRQGLVELALELAGDGPGGRAHPEDHRRDERDRDDRGAAADQLLGLEGQLAGAEGEQRADADGEQDRGGDPGPDVPEGPAAVGLDEERDQDDDDEGRFETLTKSDECIADEHDDLISGIPMVRIETKVSLT